MVFWTLKWIIISVMLIFLMHHLFTFFKDTLTVPKTKDLVQPMQLYFTSPIALASAASAPAASAAHAQATQAPESVSMQNELQQFLRDLKKPI